MTKDEFFKPIRDAVDRIDEQKRTPLPNWSLADLESSEMPHASDHDGLWKAFSDRFEAVHGMSATGFDSIPRLLQEMQLKCGYLDPALDSELKQALNQLGLETHGQLDPKRVDLYEFGITRAAGVIAETGTIILSERKTSSRLGALSPWVHVAVLEADAPIYPTLYDALLELGDDPYTVYVTGPSKTADIEGILIEGVHGPGKQICCRV